VAITMAESILEDHLKIQDGNTGESTSQFFWILVHELNLH
jgi:hypothetical protein